MENIDLKKWALELSLRVPNNQPKHPSPYLGQVQQNIMTQPTTENIIKEATKIYEWLNSDNGTK